MSFTIFNELDEGSANRIQRDALRRGKEQSQGEAEFLIDEADGVYELGGKKYYCYTKETLTALLAGVITGCHLPSDF